MALCRARPRWSRRGFIALGVSALIGATVRWPWPDWLPIPMFPQARLSAVDATGQVLTRCLITMPIGLETRATIEYELPPYEGPNPSPHHARCEFAFPDGVAKQVVSAECIDPYPRWIDDGDRCHIRSAWTFT